MEARKFRTVPLATLLAALGASSASPPSDGVPVAGAETATPRDITAAGSADPGTREGSTALRYGSGFEARNRASVRDPTSPTHPADDPAGAGDFVPATAGRESARGRKSQGAVPSKALHPQASSKGGLPCKPDIARNSSQ